MLKRGPARRHPPLESPPDFPASGRRYRIGGTLDGWQEIARLAVGNSRLELELCLALVGPVAAMLELEQPAIMLVGPAEAGKSTALVAAGSVWGRHADPNMANKLGTHPMACPLKEVYRAQCRGAGRDALDAFDEGPWGRKYPVIAQSQKKGPPPLRAARV